MTHDPLALPPDLPVPEDDGAADHLPGQPLPRITLPATDGQDVSVADISGRVVLYLYPRTGKPGESPLTEDWDLIPGARGCTPEACGFRDHHAELSALGAEVFGLSSQSTSDQREVVDRLHLPFPLLSDPSLSLAKALQLPTFTVAGVTLYKRLTMVVKDGTIEHHWYPVFPPDRHAQEVLQWLRDHPAS